MIGAYGGNGYYYSYNVIITVPKTLKLNRNNEASTQVNKM